MNVVAVLLAAGSSRRFGRAKLLAPYRGRPLYEHALEAFTSSPGVATIVVVVQPSFPVPPARPRCRFVVNPDHEEGMGSSLRAGVRAAPEDADAYLVGLADMPAVGSDLIESVIACYGSSGTRIVVPVCGGRRGHPVMIGGALRDALLAVTGDVGARGIIRAHPELVAEFDTANPAVVFDVDVPADLEAGG